MRAPTLALTVVAFGAAGIALAMPAVARAQRPAAVRVQADNDAFDFWLPPWARPDQEYTSGVRGAIEYDGGSAALARTLRAPACANATPCRRHDFSIGQSIYTGPRADMPGAPPSPARQVRPNAGWLFVEAAQRDSAASGTSEVSLAVGVVGPPALGETMQRFFHSLGPAFQRPVDWNDQLPFEPGFIARYQRVFFGGAWRNEDAWRTIPYASLGGAVGTIRTEATAGVGIRTSVSVPQYQNRVWMPHVEVSVDGLGHAVARDEFLDGTFFRSSDRVPRRTFVLEQSAAIALRWPRLTVAYRASHAGRQYDTQPVESSWGTLAAEWRPGR